MVRTFPALLLLLAACVSAPPAPPVPDVRPWVDAHVHLDFFNTAEDEPLAIKYGGLATFQPEAFADAMRRAGAGAVIAMSFQSEQASGGGDDEDDEAGGDADPYAGVEYLLSIRERVPGMAIVLGVRPEERPSRKTLERVERWATERAIVGFKLYVGYDHHYATDEVYEPYLRIAEEHQLPVVLHTGDTDTATALLKYAHPLTIDELAVTWPRVKFVMAHLGNPWTLDAAEVAYKNPNVYVDLSGLLVCDAAFFDDPANAKSLEDVRRRVREAFDYVGDPGRFLFGSDWPLAPLDAYRRFIAGAIPPEHHQAVFRDNAVRLFGLAAPEAGR